jgi:glycine C-acetyltransferase
MSSVRFICGTQDLHKTLEQRLARFLGTEDAILYAAAFDANGGLFEPLLGEGTRSSATSSTTRRSSTASACARPSAGVMPTTTWTTCGRSWPRRGPRAARFVMVFTDGVFSMDGTVRSST